MSKKILLMAGDGIGPEVSIEAEKLLADVARQNNLQLDISHALIGGAAMDATGVPLPEETLAACKASDAVLLGAVGGPKWSDPASSIRPEQGLLQMRQGLGLFANLRPVQVHPALAAISPLKEDRLKGVDIMVVRELTGGMYFGEKVEEEDYASDLCAYSRGEIERVVIRAADLARARRGHLTLVDKANVLATSRLWRRVTTQIMAERYPDISFDALLVDAAAMHLLASPGRFDVIVTENLFGDILTDEASMLAGSMGMLPSASLGAGRAAVYEPIHGSAPDIAGKGIANPFGTLASVAMMFRYSLEEPVIADRIDKALYKAVEQGQCTPDIGGNLSTSEAGAAIRRHLLA